ncbi:hypothetical protein [Streptomyces tibetensis]|uniref:hypothetical protein n=1 Tax=Streptomyces tibetensis TaxID=2382123 RepID=UPI0033E8DE25
MNGSNGSQHGGAREAPIPCPKSFLPLVGPGVPGPTERPADPVDSRERAVLMRAFAQANTGLAKAQRHLGDLGTVMVETFQSALTAIDAVERFTNGRTADEARSRVGVVRARHSADGPEGLRRSRKPWSWLQWVMLGLSGLFDLPFVGQATAQALSVGPGDLWQNVVYGLSFLVALGVSTLQFALSCWLARSLFRLRVRAAHRTERVRRAPWPALRHALRLDGPRTETRRPDDLPWSAPVLPVLANLLLLGLVATTAYTRADQSNPLAFDTAGTVMAMFLIVSLGLATSATAVLAHNPYAEAHKSAAATASDAEESADRLVSEARQRLVAHSTSWHRLRSALEQAEADAHRAVDDACVLIVEERADSGVAGSLELPLRGYAWPVGPGRDPAGADGRSGLPRLRLEILEHGDGLLDRYAPDLLEKWLEDTVDELNAQFAQPDTEPPAPPAPEDAPGDHATGGNPPGPDQAPPGTRATEEAATEPDGERFRRDTAAEPDRTPPATRATDEAAPEPDRTPPATGATGEDPPGPDEAPSA